MRFLLFICFGLVSGAVAAQPNPIYSTMNQTTRDRINLSGLQIPMSGTLLGVEGPAGQLLGDAYIDTTFQAGVIRFYGRIGGTDSLGGVPVRLDLLANEVEIRAGANDIRVAKGPSVRRFAQNNGQGGVSQYINVREYRGEADPLLGFFEQLYVGNQTTLLLHPRVIVQKGNFNMALNVGSKDDELIKKLDWYAAVKGRATKFTPNKKGVLAIMADKKDPIEAYLKARRPDLKSRTDLVALFAYYDGL